MSVVIVGGHDRMVAQYKKICKSYKCKVKVFTHMGADFNKQIGCPDLLVLFTGTVSHKLMLSLLAVPLESSCRNFKIRDAFHLIKKLLLPQMVKLPKNASTVLTRIK